MKQHKTPKGPAMVPGIRKTLWSVGDIVDLIEAEEALEDRSLLAG